MMRRIMQTLCAFGWWLLWPTPVRLRLTFQRLGPTYIKLGQFLVGRVGGEWGRQMTLLLDQVPPPSFESVRPLIEEDIGGPLDSMFRSFNEEAVGCGSMAPVYEGEWKDGRRVATKVILPGVAAGVAQDMAILRGLMSFLYYCRVPFALSMRSAQIPEQFEEAIAQEIDPRHEGSNLDRMQAPYQGTGVRIPEKVFVAKHTLVMTWMPGASLTATLEELLAQGLDPRASLRTFIEVMFVRWFVLGIGIPFQGNPSRGNLRALPNGEMGVIDLGLVGFVSSEFLKIINDAIFAVYQGKSEEVVRAMLVLCQYEFKNKRHGEQFAHDVRAYVEQAKSEPFGYWLMGMGWIVMRYGVPAPKEFAIAARFALDLDEAAKAFFPDYTVHDMLGPILKVAIIRRDTEDVIARVASLVGSVKGAAEFAARQLGNPIGVALQILAVLPEIVRSRT
jgi:ubiquinone biosynthesis protein